MRHRIFLLILILWFVVLIESKKKIISSRKSDSDVGAAMEESKELQLPRYQQLSVKSLRAETHLYSQPDRAQFGGETLGFVTPWNNVGYDYVKKFASKLNWVSPVWHEIRYQNAKLGTLGEKDVDTKWMKDIRHFARKADNMDFRIVPRLLLALPVKYKPFPEGERLHWEVTMIAEFAISRMNMYQYDGWVLDFPMVGDAAFNTMLAEMANRVAKLVKAAKKDATIIWAIPPHRVRENNEVMFDPSLLVDQSKVFDRIVVMTYDFNRPSEAVAPLPWVSFTIDKLVEYYPANQILLGLNFYGIQWQMDSPKPQHFTCTQWRKLLGSIKPSGTFLTWDDGSKEHFVEYKNAKTFYPTLASLHEKLALVSTHHLAGVGIWELGQGCPAFFDLL